METRDIEKLIAALRSGWYRQIRCWRRDNHGGYCAVGLAGQLTIGLAPEERSALVVLNDRLGLTFREIADRIEAGDFVGFAQKCLESEELIRPRDARTAVERQLIVEYEMPGGPFYELRTEINRQLEEMARTARTSIDDSHSAVDHL
jgi:hypothetical protein